MRKLNFKIPEVRQIEINGNVFDINKSDVEILNKMAEYQEMYIKVNNPDFSEIERIKSAKSAANDIFGYIDELLGDGAFLKISEGKPVNIAVAFEWLKSICGEAFKLNDDYITERYE
jgi:hypothetical protein